MAARGYKTPEAYNRALTARFKAEIPGKDITPHLRSFYFQRLTAAVFADDPSGWLLKGGQALLTRYRGQARLSRDIDLQHIDGDLESAVAAVERAASRDMDDFFSFSLVKKELRTERNLAEATFAVYIGTRVVSQIQVDIVAGRICVGTPETVSLKPAVDDMLKSPWPDVRLYPLADHVADKICAMYEWHNGNASGRYRDLADLLLISQQDQLNGHETQRALASERIRRTNLGTDLRLPAAFQTPGPAWPINYPRQAAEIRGLQGCMTWEGAKAAAETFLTPILAGGNLKMWHPREAAWI